jgi:hypothetical protein
MRRVATTVLAGALASIALAVPAHADGPAQQFCVDFNDTGNYSAHLAEDYPTYEVMRGHYVTGFVNTASGCAGLGEGYGYVWDEPNPYPAPVEDTCDPVVVEVPGPVVEVSSVQTVTDPALVEKVQKQRAKIKRLRAMIRNLKR